MDMKECPGLRNVVQESTSGARTHGGTETMQNEQSKGLLLSRVQDRWREATWKKREEKPECAWIDRNIVIDFVLHLTSTWDSLSSELCLPREKSLSSCFNPSWMPSVSSTASPLLRIRDMNSLGKIHTTSSCFLAAQSSSSWLKCSLAAGIYQQPNLFLSQSSTAPSVITTWGYHFLSHELPEQHFSGQKYCFTKIKSLPSECKFLYLLQDRRHSKLKASF